MSGAAMLESSTHTKGGHRGCIRLKRNMDFFPERLFRHIIPTGPDLRRHYDKHRKGRTVEVRGKAAPGKEEGQDGEQHHRFGMLFAETPVPEQTEQHSNGF